MMNIADLPIEFLTRIKTQLEGDNEYEEFISSLSTPLYQGLRFNSLKCESEDAESFFDMFKLERVDWCENGYYYKPETRPGKNIYHEAGLYYIQEPSAMSVAAIADVLPGERVLDLCAAPGGKSTALGAALDSGGILVSNEIIRSRCEILSSNIERMGITNALVTNETPDALAERFPKFFDCIVVDAPCSGEGMFRKESEAIPNWSPENVEFCAKRQKDILAAAIKMLKDNGRIIYSTCTFAPAEDEEMVEFLLEEYPNLKLEYSRKFWPHLDKGEGHFVAKLVAEDEEEEEFPRRLKLKQSLDNDRTKKRIFDEFARNFYTDKGYERFATGNLCVFGDRIVLLPDIYINTDKIHFMRYGLNLGRVVGDRFEPDHALAMAVKPEDVKLFISIDESEAIKFIRGEMLTTNREGKGYCVVGIKKYPLGLGKLGGTNIKNHYPKGLRRNLD